MNIRQLIESDSSISSIISQFNEEDSSDQRTEDELSLSKERDQANKLYDDLAVIFTKHKSFLDEEPGIKGIFRDLISELEVYMENMR